MDKANILPLYAAPQYAEQVTDWIWHAFGDGLPREFFQSIVEHSQTPGALPLTTGSLKPPFLCQLAQLVRLKVFINAN